MAAQEVIHRGDYSQTYQVMVTCGIHPSRCVANMGTWAGVTCRRCLSARKKRAATKPRKRSER